jgi:hypothetical protein
MAVLHLREKKKHRNIITECIHEGTVKLLWSDGLRPLL